MGDVKARFVVPAGCAPTACCDPDSKRYATGYALVSPAEDGVWVSATDTRCASIVKLEGETDGTHYFPMKAVGKGKPVKRDGTQTEAVLNGRWECEGKFFSANDAAGRFPDVPRVIPDVEGYDSDMVAVTIDVALLAKLVSAVGTTPECRGVTLLMRRNLTAPDDQRVVSGPIAVCGAYGIGILMPMVPDVDVVRKSIRQVEEVRKEYTASFAQPVA